MRIALFYCTAHISTQKSEILFESKKYLGLSFVGYLFFFLIRCSWYIKLAGIERLIYQISVSFPGQFNE